MSEYMDNEEPPSSKAQVVPAKSFFYDGLYAPSGFDMMSILVGIVLSKVTIPLTMLINIRM